MNALKTSSKATSNLIGSKMAEVAAKLYNDKIEKVLGNHPRTLYSQKIQGSMLKHQEKGIYPQKKGNKLLMS